VDVDRVSLLERALVEAEAAVSAVPSGLASGTGELEALRDRLRQGRFHLAVLGQFKRGKSTLVNALLGEPLLPASVLPVTAIPTYLRAASHRAVLVSYLDDRPVTRHDGLTATSMQELLVGLVTEEGNPHNKLGISSVELEHPAEFLRRGAVLIDTPGIGSTLSHNTEATLRFLPHCDGAILVVSADPPLTAAEAEFLGKVEARVARLFVVLNKIDYLDPGDLEAAREFLISKLAGGSELVRNAPVFAVSARAGLLARLADDPVGWRDSGMANLEQCLSAFLVEGKAAALVTAIAGKAVTLVDQAMLQTSMLGRSLQMPLEDLEQRLAMLEESLCRAEVERRTAIDVLDGDFRRATEYLEAQAESLRSKARQELMQRVEAVLADDSHTPDAERQAEEAVSQAIPAMFERELGRMSDDLSRLSAGLIAGHQAKLDDLIRSVYTAAAEAFDLAPFRPAPAEDFGIRQQPYWVKYDWNVTLGVVSPQAIDRLLPAPLRRERVRRRLEASVDALVIRNVENLRWAALQGLQRVFQRFRLLHRDQLEKAFTATRTTAEQARRLRASVAESADEQLAAIGAVEEQLRLARGRVEAVTECSP